MIRLTGGNDSMKRIFVLVTVFIGVALLTVGCSNAKEEPPKVELQEMIMIKNKIWKNTGFPMTVQVDEDEIKGEVTSTVESFEIPTENDQANFDIKGSKYSLYGKNFVVSIDNEWILFLKEEDWTTIDKTFNNIITIDYSKLDLEVFGDLSQEEIDNLFMDISNEIYEDEDYESNLNSIIVSVFKEYGLDISSNIDEVMSNLKISKPNSK